MLGPVAEQADALIAAWYPGSEGQGGRGRALRRLQAHRQAFVHFGRANFAVAGSEWQRRAACSSLGLVELSMSGIPRPCYGNRLFQKWISPRRSVHPRLDHFPAWKTTLFKRPKTDHTRPGCPQGVTGLVFFDLVAGSSSKKSFFA